MGSVYRSLPYVIICDEKSFPETIERSHITHNTQYNDAPVQKYWQQLRQFVPLNNLAS